MTRRQCTHMLALAAVALAATRSCAAARASADTVLGKVMVGYQGWFATPGDGAKNRWIHWLRNQTPVPESFVIDMWPDTTEFDDSWLVDVGELKVASGAPARLFSSATPGVVAKHFEWMAKYDIAGAYLQRFVNFDNYETDQTVLRNVRAGAAAAGRVWAIEYDVSGLPSDYKGGRKLQADWEWLVNTEKVTSDPEYLHEGGKLVVVVWGLTHADRGFHTFFANRIVKWLQEEQGAYVVGGLTNEWRGLNGGWQSHMKLYDGVLVWQPQDVQSDEEVFAGRGQAHFPHVAPGFSWKHLQKGCVPPNRANCNGNEREGGARYWRNIMNAMSVAPDGLFIGMFDEFDEGTAIAPMTSNTPPAASYGKWVTNQGLHSHYWMMLTGEATALLAGELFVDSALPAESKLVAKYDPPFCSALVRGKAQG